MYDKSQKVLMQKKKLVVVPVSNFEREIPAA